MCALESSGGSGTTTAGGSSSTGTSDVAGLTVQGTAPSQAEFVQEGSGTTNLFNTTLNTVNITGGSLVQASTATIFKIVGTITRIGTAIIQFMDTFSDGTVDSVWSQTAANGSISEAGGLLTLSFGAGANAVLDPATTQNQPRVVAASPYGTFAATVEIDSITFTTPAAGDIYCGIYQFESVGSEYYGIAIERRSGGGTNLVTFRGGGGAGAIAYTNRTALASTSNVWLQIQQTDTGGSTVDVACYYRTSAPTRDSNTYTLLGSVASDDVVSDFALAGLACWESTNSTGAVTVNYGQIQILPLLGPG